MMRPLIGGKEFEAWKGQGEQAQGRSRRLTKERGVCCVEERRKEENECVSKRLVLMCVEGCCSKKKCVQELSMERFPWQSFGVLFQIVFPPKSTVGFMSNLKQFMFRKCRRFFPNFSIIGFVVRELHLPEVEGVCSGVHERISMTKLLEFCFKLLFLPNPSLDLCQT